MFDALLSATELAATSGSGPFVAGILALLLTSVSGGY